MKYHITITDNETGKVFDEADTNCIIGSYQNEGGAASITLGYHCTDTDVALVIMGVEEGVRHIKKKKGILFTALVEMLASSYETEDKSAELRKSEEN